MALTTEKRWEQERKVITIENTTLHNKNSWKLSRGGLSNWCQSLQQLSSLSMTKYRDFWVRWLKLKAQRRQNKDKTEEKSFFYCCCCWPLWHTTVSKMIIRKKKEKANQCCWLITWGQRTHSSQNWWSPTAAAKLHLKISRSKNAKEKTVIRQFTATNFPLFLLNGPTAAAALTTLTQIRISDRSAGRQADRQARIGKGTERKKEATIDLGDQKCCCSTDLWSKQQQLNLFVHWAETAAAAMANCHWQFACCCGCCRCCRQIKQTKRRSGAIYVWRQRRRHLCDASGARSLAFDYGLSRWLANSRREV